MEKRRQFNIGLDSMLEKVKWASVLIPILVQAGRASSTAKGTSALTVGNQNFRELSSQTDLDVGHLENSTSRLESQGSPTELKETRPPSDEAGRTL